MTTGPPFSCWLAPPSRMPEKKPCRDWRPEKGESFLSHGSKLARWQCVFFGVKTRLKRSRFFFGWDFESDFFIVCANTIRGNGVVLGFCWVFVLSPSHVDHPPQSIITIITTTTISTNKQQPATFTSTTTTTTTVSGWDPVNGIHDQLLPGGSDQTGRQCRWEISVPPKKSTWSHQKK